jgi:hypothetical protein
MSRPEARAGPLDRTDAAARAPARLFDAERE